MRDEDTITHEAAYDIVTTYRRAIHRAIRWIWVSRVGCLLLIAGSALTLSSLWSLAAGVVGGVVFVLTIWLELRMRRDLKEKTQHVMSLRRGLHAVE